MSTGTYARYNGLSGAGSGSSGVATVGPFGSTPNANAAVIAGSVLTLEPADATHPGGLSTTTQTIAGDKTFSGNVVGGTLKASTPGTNTAPGIFISPDGTHVFGVGTGSASKPGLVGYGGIDFVVFNTGTGSAEFFSNVRGCVAFPSAVSSPAFTIGGDSDTGFYRVGTGVWGFASTGVDVLQIDSNGLRIASGQINGVNAATGGNVNITAGNGTNTSTAGGSMTLSGGTVAGSASSGAIVTVGGAQGSGAPQGGPAFVMAGNGDTGVVGGAITLQAGGGNNAVTNPAILTIQGGDASAQDGEFQFFGHLASSLGGLPNPVATPTANAGTGATATVSTNASDTAGVITLTAGLAALAIGDQVDVVFNMPYLDVPVVMLTPVSRDAGADAVGCYVNSTTTGFSLNFAFVGTASLVYAWNYSVVGSDA